MRLYKYIMPVIVGLLSPVFTACENEHSDIFCDDAATRLNSRMQECKDVLCSSTEGWIMDYFPDRYLSYGGRVYGLKFTPEEVTVTSEDFPGETEKSYYKMSGEDGPLLSFDTYNKIMHYYATPSFTEYHGKDGDFELRVVDVQRDLITLQGVRSGNLIYMHRATSDVVDYVKQAAEMGEAMFPTMFDGTVGSANISATNDAGTRYMEFTQGDGEPVGSYYVPTPTGLRFIEPVTVNGTTLTELSFNPDDYVLSDSNAGLNMVGSLPADYALYSEYLGGFTLNYYWGTLEIKISDDGTGKGYLINLGKEFDVKASYNKSKGRMELNCQKVGEDSGYDVYFMAWSANTGYVSQSTDAGVVFKKDPDKPGVFNCTSNDFTGLVTDSFIMYYVDNGEYVGGAQSNACLLRNDDYRLPYPESIVKK